MLIDRFIGCLFLCLCALLWFVIIPQQISGEEQAMYPRRRFRMKAGREISGTGYAAVLS